jgi:hypothetical protein
MRSFFFPFFPLGVQLLQLPQINFKWKILQIYNTPGVAASRTTKRLFQDGFQYYKCCTPWKNQHIFKMLNPFVFDMFLGVLNAATPGRVRQFCPILEGS